MQSKDDLMIYINEVKEDYEILSVDAIIEDNTIIPGINGISVNSKKSYSKMKALDVFNEYYLEFEEVKPVVSLNDNKDKVIIKGNKNKNAVSIIIKNNYAVKQYLENRGYITGFDDICVIDIDRDCKKNDYKLKSSLILNHQNILTHKNQVSSGDIILIEENVSVSEIKLLLDEISYRDLTVIPLNKLISEENNIN